MSSKPIGRIIRIAGPIVEFKIEKTGELTMNELLYVGKRRLVGELIGLREEEATVQVFESTIGLKHGEPIFKSGELLSVELGPGLLGSIFDGLQRPMLALRDKVGDFIYPATVLPALPRDLKWRFEPAVSKMDTVGPGDTLGWVQERWLRHRIMVPPKTAGTVVDIAGRGDYRLEDRICVLRTEAGLINLSLYHRWPVRTPRPYRYRVFPDEPLITGQRVLDTFFPMVKGGKAAITGGFGTGKTVLLQQLTKFLETDVMVYVGCGERGNEVADLLSELAELEDPRTGAPLMDRSILVVNTSDMPVAARESSVYTGMAMAEYYRDMGLDVGIMVDSTSRWAEAMRFPEKRGTPHTYLPRSLDSTRELGRLFLRGLGLHPDPYRSSVQSHL